MRIWFKLGNMNFTANILWNIINQYNSYRLLEYKLHIRKDCLSSLVPSQWYQNYRYLLELIQSSDVELPTFLNVLVLSRKVKLKQIFLLKIKCVFRDDWYNFGLFYNIKLFDVHQKKFTTCFTSYVPLLLVINIRTSQTGGVHDTNLLRQGYDGERLRLTQHKFLLPSRIDFP